MKTRFLVWKDPRCNGINPEWKDITAQEFYDLIRSGANKGRYFIAMPKTSDEKDDGKIFIEVNQAEYKDWKKEANREYYLNITYRNIPIISYEALTFDDGNSFGEEMLADKTTDVEDEVLRRMESERLKQILAQFTPDEYSLIQYFFLSEKPGTVRGYGSLAGIPYKTADNRKRAILKKLREILEN